MGGGRGYYFYRGGGGLASEVEGDGDTRLTLMDNLSLTTALEIYGGGGGVRASHTHTLTHRSCMRKKNRGVGGSGMNGGRGWGVRRTAPSI